MKNLRKLVLLALVFAISLIEIKASIISTTINNDLQNVEVNDNKIVETFE